jgi:hypothetical protein
MLRQHRHGRALVVDITVEIMRAGNSGPVGPVKQPEFVAELECEPAAGSADEAGASDEEDFHALGKRMWKRDAES